MSVAPRPVAITALDIEGRKGAAIYPTPFQRGLEGRVKRALGNVFGLDQFGVNLVTLEPGTMSSQRHWHEREDEFIYVLEGTLTLVTDAGDTQLTAGMAAGFPAGDANGHHLINRTDMMVSYLEVGTRSDTDAVDYPDIDMKATKTDGRLTLTRKDGSSFDASDS